MIKKALKKLSLSVISFQVDFAYNKTDAANNFQIQGVWKSKSLL